MYNIRNNEMENQMEQFIVRLPKSMIERIENVATELDRNKSDATRRIIDAGLLKYELARN